jgi:cell division protein DivIC
MKLPKAFRNFYIVTGTLFLLWMLFLDANNALYMYGITSKVRSLEDEREYRMLEREETLQDYNELFGNRKTLEKFAREKYLMKKETEDVFVIVEDEN